MRPWSNHLSQREKEMKLDTVLEMFPLLSKDHFLYSTLERYNWDIPSSISSLQSRHSVLEQEQRQIERRIEETRVKRELERREKEKEARMIASLRDIFGSKFTEYQYSRTLFDYKFNLENTINYFMRESEKIEYQADLLRKKRLDDEERARIQREIDEFERIERNRRRMNQNLIELKNLTEDQKREIAQSKLFQDFLREYGIDGSLNQPPHAHPTYPPHMYHHVFGGVHHPPPVAQPSHNPFATHQDFWAPPTAHHQQPAVLPPPMGTTSPQPQLPLYPYQSSPTSSPTNNNNNNNKNPSFSQLDPFEVKMENAPTTTTTPAPVQPTTTATSTPPSVRGSEEYITQLKIMFPTIPEQVIRSTINSSPNISQTISTLLNLSSQKH
eukprot:gene8582-10560_t